MNESDLIRQQDQLRHFPTLLARWAGSIARMESLEASCPRSLRITLTRSDLQGFLRLACVYPEHIHGPTEWQNTQIEIFVSNDGNSFVVCDKIADVKIVTAKVEISEHK